MEPLIHRLIIKIDLEMLAWLKRQAELNHESVSAFLRRLIREARNCVQR